MATNLLLEGDDLEALLIKAHSEGGPNARIVRADKYRHGGLWGFFARERFEVAVEIPELPRPDGEGSAFFVAPTGTTGPNRTTGGDAWERRTGRHTAADQRVATRYATAETAEATEDTAAAEATEATEDSAAVRHAPGQAGEAAAERLVDQLTAHLAEQFASASPLPPPITPTEPTAPPAPAAFAADGLLGIVDRVSAAERAATRAVRARYADTSADTSADGADATPATPGTPATIPPAAPARHIDLPVAEPVRASRPAELVGAGRGAGTANRPATPMWTGSPSPSGSPSDRDATPTNGTVTSAMNGSKPATTAPAGPAAGVPHEPSLTPALPSTSRPEFTALLDTLRDGARPGRATRPAAPHPDVPAGRDDDAITEPIALVFEPAPNRAPAPAEDLVFDVMPPVERATPQAVRIPAQPGPSPSELNDQGLPEIGTQQDDPRNAADRRTLHALGVPAAWTRRLRPGDRFAEVLRMLERMPQEDIDPATTIVAIVGAADTVRLEAHRTALDLAVAGEPRPVVVVPSTVGTDRAAAIARALRSGPVVLAVEADGDEASLVLDTLTTVRAGAVIAVVDATARLERTQRWLDALGQVDALVLAGATEVTDPAAVLQLGLPVVRLDGIPVDRVTWAAVLCAQLMAAEQAAEQAVAER